MLFVNFKAIVTKWPDDAFSKARTGLILKLEGKLEEALPLLLEGLWNDEDVGIENGKILLP